MLFYFIYFVVLSYFEVNLRIWAVLALGRLKSSMTAYTTPSTPLCYKTRQSERHDEDVSHLMGVSLLPVLGVRRLEPTLEGVP